jgi:hypothetical protein
MLLVVAYLQRCQFYLVVTCHHECFPFWITRALPIQLKREQSSEDATVSASNTRWTNSETAITHQPPHTQSEDGVHLLLSIIQYFPFASDFPR